MRFGVGLVVVVGVVGAVGATAGDKAVLNRVPCLLEADFRGICTGKMGKKWGILLSDILLLLMQIWEIMHFAANKADCGT